MKVEIYLECKLSTPKNTILYNPLTKKRIVWKGGKAKNFQHLVTLAAIDAMRGKQLITGAVIMDVVFYVKVPKGFSGKKRQAALNNELYPTKRPDRDNYLKLTQDALNGVVYKDDAQIVDGSVAKRYSLIEGLRIEVHTIEGL